MHYHDMNLVEKNCGRDELSGLMSKILQATRTWGLNDGLV